MKKTPELEREANVFATLLLIPEQCIKEDLRIGVDLGDDKAMKKLCDKYQVTSSTMTLRLSLLKNKL